MAEVDEAQLRMRNSLKLGLYINVAGMLLALIGAEQIVGTLVAKVLYSQGEGLRLRQKCFFFGVCSAGGWWLVACWLWQYMCGASLFRSKRFNCYQVCKAWGELQCGVCSTMLITSTTRPTYIYIFNGSPNMYSVALRALEFLLGKK